jgi:hypothetical protein
MHGKSEVFSTIRSSNLEPQQTQFDLHSPFRFRDLLETAIVFILVMVAVWTPRGPLNAFASISAAACVVAFAAMGRWSARELGLRRPLTGAGYILMAGAVLCGAIVLIGIPVRFAGAGNPLPLNRSWQYVIWALAQEFILQCIFYLRLESLVGSRRAVLAAAGLFAVAHIPSPLLTMLSFFGGVLFCEFFRRWRNLYALGIIHGALGLTIARSLPDHWLHHMRVGIGFMRFN